MKKSDARKKNEKNEKKHVFFPKKTRNEKNVFFHNPSDDQVGQLFDPSAPQDMIHVVRTRSRLRVWIGIVHIFFMVL